jgi:DNA-binding NarL/FixJ family response regulator
LRAEGYEVDGVRSGSEALVRVAQSLPDLIVSDIRMPRMDGYALARQLRSSRRTDLIPIIFLSAKDETADRIAGFRSGVDAYLTKPFEPDELLAVIGNILKRVERTHGEIARLVGTSDTNKDVAFGDEELTEAEERIASAVARGLSNKEIGIELDISVRTVENHISHILAKKKLDNRVGIARYVLAGGNAE